VVSSGAIVDHCKRNYDKHAVFKNVYGMPHLKNKGRQWIAILSRVTYTRYLSYLRSSENLVRSSIFLQPQLSSSSVFL